MAEKQSAIVQQAGGQVGVERLMLRVAYDGAGLRGWQSQEGGGTVQDLLEEAFRAVTGVRVRVVGSGRTDAGVHALRQCAHVDVPSMRMDGRAWRMALNSHLPATIRVMKVSKVHKSFHARFDAVSKHYRYTIRNAETLPPFEAGRVWLVPWKLDTEAMRQAACNLMGTHDFRRLSAVRKGDSEPGIRTITRAEVRRCGSLIILDFEGNGFLYKMVRIMTALLVRVGSGRMDIEELRMMLEEPAGRRATHCAPADGLVLMDVVYAKF